MSNDYELLYLASEKDELAIEELYKKYYEFIKYKISKYKPAKSERQDYLNQANLAFLNAIENYKDDNKFITFLNICIDRALINYKKISNNKKNMLLNNAININDISTIIDDTYNPEKILLEEENYQETRKEILKRLSYKEELVFILKEQNYTFGEISQILDSNIEKIYKIMQEIRKKTNLINITYN